MIINLIHLLSLTFEGQERLLIATKKRFLSSLGLFMTSFLTPFSTPFLTHSHHPPQSPPPSLHSPWTANIETLSKYPLSLSESTRCLIASISCTMMTHHDGTRSWCIHHAPSYTSRYCTMHHDATPYGSPKKKNNNNCKQTIALFNDTNHLFSSLDRYSSIAALNTN